MPCNKIKQDFNFTTLKGFKIIKLTTLIDSTIKKNPAPYMVFDSFFSSLSIVSIFVYFEKI
jgi:hypothetical protein